MTLDQSSASVLSVSIPHPPCTVARALVARNLFELTEDAISQAEHKRLILDPRFNKSLFVNYPQKTSGRIL